MDTVERADATVRETARLIASDKVEGTATRDSAGNKIGTIERVMIDKRTGKVAYAVMSFGGFLGMGADYVSLPWHVLRYNERPRRLRAERDREPAARRPACCQRLGYRHGQPRLGTQRP